MSRHAQLVLPTNPRSSYIPPVQVVAADDAESMEVCS